MKLMLKFYLWLHNFSDFKKLFPRYSMENCLWCYFRLLFISIAFTTCEKVFNILKNYPRGKAKLLDPLSDFVLIILLSVSKGVKRLPIFTSSHYFCAKAFFFYCDHYMYRKSTALLATRQIPYDRLAYDQRNCMS